VITPVGFTEHSVKGDVYAGKGMVLRSKNQYGIRLTPGVTGKLAQGIGMGQSTGHGVLPHTELRDHTVR